MIKLALAIAAAALAFVVTPASAGHRGSHRHHSSGHAHAHAHHSHHQHHVHAHPSQYHHHSYAHAHKPVHYAYSHGHTYSAPTYVQPHVATSYAPTNCFWQVQKHGYEHRKVWVCPQAQYKTVEHVKPEVKVVEVAPAPEVPQ